MTNPTPSATPLVDKPTWAQTLRVYLEPASLRMLSLGFSAGLPLLLVLGTLSFRLREAGVDRTSIGFLSWVGLAYAFKWVWAPLVDRLPIPLLTRALGLRRSWLLLAQIAVMLGLVGMAVNDPRAGLEAVVWCALAVAFGSATQDIALDAFRIESADSERQAVLAAAYQTGYRLAMIWAGAGVLWIAARAEVSPALIAPGAVLVYQNAAWQTAYLVMAASMSVGVLTVLYSKEPQPRDQVADNSELRATAQRFVQDGIPLYGVCLAPLFPAMVWVLLRLSRDGALPWDWLYLLLALFLYIFCIAVMVVKSIRVPIPAQFTPLAAWFTHSFFDPFADFVRRYRWQAGLILALIATYRISDVVMGIMANPFYVDMGFTKDEVAAVTKIYGVVMTLVGAFLGGAMAMRWGVMRVLLLGAVLSAATNLLFAWLAGRGHDLNALIFVVSADNLASGIASAGFIAYLSSLTNVNYSATQYALFSSMMLLLPKFLAGYSGMYVDHFGYASFFTSTAALGLPVLVLVWLASRVKTPSSAQ